MLTVGNYIFCVVGQSTFCVCVCVCRFLDRPNSTFAVSVLDMFLLPFIEMKCSLCIVIKAQINVWYLVITVHAGARVCRQGHWYVCVGTGIGTCV